MREPTEAQAAEILAGTAPVRRHASLADAALHQSGVLPSDPRAEVVRKLREAISFGEIPGSVIQALIDDGYSELGYPPPAG